MSKSLRHELLIDKNAIVDEGDGTIRFNGGLTLSDESEQLNGTRYDIASMDISRFDGTVFADHDYSIKNIVGKAFGVAKQGKRLVGEGVRFAVQESALARFAYEMVRGGFINAVSIGTTGAMPDDEGKYENAVLKEFSFVGLGNNENATINKVSEIAHNAIEQSEKDGLDTSELRELVSKNHILDEPKAEGEQQVNPQENHMSDEPQTPAAEPEAPAETPAEQPAETPSEAPAEAPATDENAAKLMAAVNKLADKVDSIEKQAFNSGAQEPAFTPAKSGASDITANSLGSMDSEEITQNQVDAWHKMVKKHDPEAAAKLKAINEHNLIGLKEAKLVKNTVTMADFGNFVTNPELMSEIVGYRTDFSEVLAAFPYQQTNSLQMSWSVRSGDIDMQNVEMCDDGADGNLKPNSEYTTTTKTQELEELAAVTPVCSAAQIFLASDILGDIALGYRTSYDRNKARGVIAALELAAEDADENSVSFGGTTAAEKLDKIRQAIFVISQGEGLLVMSEATYGVIWSYLVEAGQGHNLTETIVNGTTFRQLYSKRVVVVPNELMPTLGDTGTYRTYDFYGSSVTINHAIFYVNPQNWKGRENGGLRYDLSTEAAYTSGGQLRSAYERDEIVLRGYHYRGSKVLDVSRVGAVRAGTVIS